MSLEKLARITRAVESGQVACTAQVYRFQTAVVKLRTEHKSTSFLLNLSRRSLKIRGSCPASDLDTEELKRRKTEETEADQDVFMLLHLTHVHILQNLHTDHHARTFRTTRPRKIKKNNKKNMR